MFYKRIATIWPHGTAREVVWAVVGGGVTVGGRLVLASKTLPLSQGGYPNNPTSIPTWEVIASEGLLEDSAYFSGRLFTEWS